MKRPRIWKITYSNKKAQALTELAVFGSVALFCLAMLVRFGLIFNYQQRIQAEAFRKAVLKAYHFSQNQIQVSYSIFRDRRIADPQDPYGASSERMPLSASSSVTFSDETLSSASGDSLGEGLDNQDSLPALLYEYPVGGQQIPDEEQYTYYSEVRHLKPGAYRVYSCDGSVKVKIDDLEDKNGDGVYWKWQEVSCDSGNVNYMSWIGSATEAKWEGAVDSDEDGDKDDPVTSADVDNDGQEEIILQIIPGFEVETMQNGQKKGTYQKIEGFIVLDSQEGDIDNTIPEDKKIAEGQGLLPDTTTTLSNDSKISTIQMTGTTNNLKVKSKETIKRTFKRQDPGSLVITKDEAGDIVVNEKNKPKNIVEKDWTADYDYKRDTTWQTQGQ
ncbi:MAG: hypothetical protein AB1472_00485 [Candidatus Omnitrophota bacterium]